MATQMTKFMEVITNVNRRQEELDAIVNNKCCYPVDGGNHGLYQDISVGLGDVQDHPVGNFHGMPENPFVRNVGQFPPSPGPRLVGNKRANQGGVRNYQDHDFDFISFEWDMNGLYASFPFFSF